MFSGIIKEVGTVKGVSSAGPSRRLEIESKNIFDRVDIGDSVAVNGVCLTLVKKERSFLSFDVMEETIRKSSLADVKSGLRVNLEDALRADGSIGGHFVQGHIDCLGKITEVKNKGNETVMTVKIPKHYGNLIVEKGSISIDGISLTIGEVGPDNFSVYLIPHTLNVTTLGARRTGDSVNIEFDIIGKYLARFQEFNPSSKPLTEDFLRDRGF